MQSPVRSVTSLNGLWDFVFLGSLDLQAFHPAEVAFTEKALVPSAFDALPMHAGKRGAAIYRTRFSLSAGSRGRLEFGAVAMWTRIFIDGQIAFEHACGYAPFTVDVPISDSSERELVVLADNRFDFERVPMHEEHFDFYQYGGVIRDVTLLAFPSSGPFIDTVQVTPTPNGYRDGEIEIAVFLGNSVAGSLSFSTAFDGVPEVIHRDIPLLEGVARLILRVPEPALWSPQSPNLHKLQVALLGDPADALTVRFGLRRIEARNGALWLNGEKLILKGYNRHEWHPNSGPCTSVLQMAVDLQLLKDLGCNFIRGSHYPQDQRFLDLCDELGFLVWEENLGWQQREKSFASAKFRRDHSEAIRAMVKASFNHPSVVIWGFLNEAPTNEEYVRPVFEETVNALRALDATRLISYASMFALTDTCYDLVDLVSLNLYPGWYGAEGEQYPLELIAPKFAECFAHIDAAGWSDKPVLISEIGAEAIYGWHDPHHDFFTEEFQAAYLEQAITEALGHPRCSGIALWHFSDARTYGGSRALTRPRTFNNKGTLDEYRRPKISYHTVKRVFAAYH